MPYKSSPLHACLLVAVLALAACEDPATPDDPRPDQPADTQDQGVADLGLDLGAPDQGVEDEDMATAPMLASLAVVLEREDGKIVVEVAAQDAQGRPVDASQVMLAVDRGALGALDRSRSGYVRALVTPPPGLVSGVIRVTASAGDAITVTRDALVFAQIDEAWGQPEAVPGLVNTPGWEDSTEISPDGEWLIVGTYSPVDLLACILTGQQAMPPRPYGLVDAPECNAALGPYDAPARPQLPGASRIKPGKIHHVCPSVGAIDPADPDGDFLAPLPPVAAYGFKRQPDGTFADPFLIAFGVDGCTGGPFGFTFPEGSFDAARASMVFSFNDYRNDGPLGDTDNDLFIVRDVSLGSPLILGTYSIANNIISAADFKPVRLDIPDEGGEGNPFVAREGVFFDNEGAEDIDIFFTRSGALGAGPLPARERVAVSGAGTNEFQPFVYAERLYYARDFQQLRSASWTDRGKVDASAFAQDKVELGVGQPNLAEIGAILAMGEPSLARDADGVEWLYFVYGMREVDGSVNQSVGRVRRR
jgi:hypothetical protein